MLAAEKPSLDVTQLKKQSTPKDKNRSIKQLLNLLKNSFVTQHVHKQVSLLVDANQPATPAATPAPALPAPATPDPVPEADDRVIYVTYDAHAEPAAFHIMDTTIDQVRVDTVYIFFFYRYRLE